MCGDAAAKPERERFIEFCRRAHGFEPYPWQIRVAMEGLPDLITAPTAAGKTAAVVLGWLWRRLCSPGDEADRLVLILPLRALITDVESQVRGWLDALGLSGQVDVHAMMGGGSFDRDEHQRWREDPQRPSVVLATVDAGVSALLHRGYFATRPTSTIDMALMTSNAHVVLDEGHLSGQAVSTLRQINAFQRGLGTYGTVGLTVMSATMPLELMETVDNPAVISVLDVSDEDRAGLLARRLGAERSLAEIPSPTFKRIADTAVSAAKQAAGLVVIVGNTIETVRGVYAAVRRAKPDCDVLLMHSRFRGEERRRQQERLEQMRDSGGIIVSTQCLEAGVDLDARVLITEASPIAPFVQRVGRCNRAGQWDASDSQIRWFSPLKPGPYDKAEVAQVVDLLAAHEGEKVTADILADWRAQLPEPDVVRRILRRRDFDQLFDTSPDLAGDDVDIRPYISPDEDIDVAIAWVPEEELTRDALANRPRKPPPQYMLCPVPLSAAKAFIDRSGVTAAAYRAEDDQWRVVTDKGALRPRDILLVSSTSGGYTVDEGFDHAKRGVVPVVELPDDETPDADGTDAEPGAGDPQGEWIGLDQHLRDAEQQAASLLDATDLIADEGVLRAVRAAARYHDLGKAFDPCQSILGDKIPDGGPWAKSPQRRDARGRPVYRRITGDRRGLRHEVVSALMLLSDAGREALDAAGVPRERHFLVVYLVAAHHGKLRVSVRDPRRDGRRGDALFGLRDDDLTPALALDSCMFDPVPVRLDMLTDPGPEGWAARTQELIDEFGPFRLGMLESLVRIADWRASGGRELCEVE